MLQHGTHSLPLPGRPLPFPSSPCKQWPWHLGHHAPDGAADPAGDSRHHTDTIQTGAVLNHPYPIQKADPGLFYLQVVTEASPASHPMPVPVSSEVCPFTVPSSPQAPAPRTCCSTG